MAMPRTVPIHSPLPDVNAPSPAAGGPPRQSGGNRRVVYDPVVLHRHHTSDDDSDDCDVDAPEAQDGGVVFQSSPGRAQTQQRSAVPVSTQRLSPRQLAPGDTMTNEWPTSTILTEDHHDDARCILPRRSAAAQQPPRDDGGKCSLAHRQQMSHDYRRPAGCTDTLGGSPHNGSYMDLLVGSSSDEEATRRDGRRRSTSTDEGKDDDARLFHAAPRGSVQQSVPPSSSTKVDNAQQQQQQQQQHTIPPPPLSRKASRALAAKRALWYRAHCTGRGRESSCACYSGPASSGLVTPASHPGGTEGGIGDVDVSSVSETYLSGHSDQHRPRRQEDGSLSTSVWSPEQRQRVVVRSASSSSSRTKQQQQADPQNGGVVVKTNEGQHAHRDAGVNEDNDNGVSDANVLEQRHNAWLRVKAAAARALLVGDANDGEDNLASYGTGTQRAGAYSAQDRGGRSGPHHQGVDETALRVRSCSRSGSGIAKRNGGGTAAARGRKVGASSAHATSAAQPHRQPIAVITTSSWRQRPSSALGVDEDWTKLPQRPQFRDDAVVDPAVDWHQRRPPASTRGASLVQHQQRGILLDVPTRRYVPPPLAVEVPTDANKDALHRKQEQAQRAREKMLHYAESNRVQAMRWQRKHDDAVLAAKAPMLAASSGGGGGGGGGGLRPAYSVAGDARQPVQHHRDPSSGHPRAGGASPSGGSKPGSSSSPPSLRKPLAHRRQGDNRTPAAVGGTTVPNSWDVLKHFVGRPSAML